MNIKTNYSTGFPTFRFPKIDSNPTLTYVSLPIPKALDPSRIVSYIYHPFQPNLRLLIIDDSYYFQIIKAQAFLAKNKNPDIDEDNIDNVMIDVDLWENDIDLFLNFYDNLSIISLKKAMWMNKTIHKQMFYNNDKKIDRMIQHRFRHIKTHGQKRSEIRNQFQKNRFQLDYSI